MEVAIRMDGNVAILDLTGDLVASTGEGLKTRAAELEGKGIRHILLKMTRVGFMDSSGLGACMELSRSLNAKGGMLACAQPSETVHKVFRITGADRKLAVLSSTDEGIRLLKGNIEKTGEREGA